MKGLMDSLYQRAEAALGQRTNQSHEQFAALSPAEAQRMLHDLQVHQVELEMQNEELRRTQAALDTSRAHYLDFYDLAPVGYCTVSGTGLINEVNLATCTLLNVPRSQLIKRPISSFIFNDDQGIYYHFRHSLTDTDKSLSCELRMLKREGTPFWAHLLVSAVPDGDGNSLLRMVISDITKRKQIETVQRESEIYKLAILNSVSAEIAVLDHRGVIRAVNQPWLRFAAKTPNEAGKPVAHIDVGTDYLAICQSAAESSADGAQYALDGIRGVLNGNLRAFSLDYPCHSPTQQRWFTMTVSPLEAVRDGGVVVVHTDITERKQAEALLQFAISSAQIANDSKSRFLAAASHDLRQPMAALALYIGMLSRTANPGQEKLVSDAQSCVDTLSAMLNDLLDVSKLDAGAMVPTISDFSVEELCTALQAIYLSKAEKKGLRLRCRPGAHLILRTDRRMLHRLIGNLIDNAVAYTAQGGVLVASRRHGGKLWLEVWDTGIGMAQDHIPLIFEEFKQLGDNSRNRGSGLGLSIASKMAALLGLEMRVRSRLGRGSVFSITLPEGDALVPVQPPAKAGRQTFTVGMVEDNLVVLDALVMELQGLGHTVFAGTSGADLLEQLGEMVPDVLISDYRLGSGATGLDVIAAVRTRFRSQLPAIILTGDTDPDLLHRTDKDVAVLFKPLQLGELQEALIQVTGT